MITDGISAAQWSPDQELLVLLTISNGLILMTKDFDILNEQLISVRNKVELEYVNVGWGSFETQFKGSAGKNYVKEKVKIELKWHAKLITLKIFSCEGRGYVARLGSEKRFN